MKKLIIIFFVLSTFFLLTDCHKSEYHRQLSQQLASGTRFDTIIFDIYFGMARKDFYTYCWEKNREGIFTNGSTNTTVRYKATNYLSKPAYIDFYPTFYEDRILELPIYFSYEGFSPWDKSYQVDSLYLDVKNYLTKFYDIQFNDFILPQHKEPVLVNIKGNRRILLRKENDKVVALFSDMSKNPDAILKPQKNG